MTLDFWSIVILICAVQGLFFLSLMLLDSVKRKKAENKYLFLVVLLFVWFLLEFFAIRNTLKIDVDLFYGTRYGSWFLLGPLTFFFFQSITQTDWRFTKYSLIHLIPFIVFAICIPLLSDQSLSQRQIHYGMLAVFDYRPKTVTAFEYLYSTVFYLQFIHLAGYLFFNWRSIKGYVKQVKNTYAQVNNSFWLYLFNNLLIVSLLLASVFLYVLFETDIYRRSWDYIYVLPMGLFIYAVGYRLSGISWLPVEKEHKRYQSSALKPTEVSGYLSQLEHYMNTEKPYLKNDLRLKDLALGINLSNHQLSQLINENHQLSFFDYINKFRVNEAKDLIKQHPKHTLLHIAFEAGFNNKTSFVNAFKKFEGQTPSSYKKASHPKDIR